MAGTAWIPGSAWDQLAEVQHEVPALAEIRALKRRRRGRGWQILVTATPALAKHFASEAAFWAGDGVDPESRYRVRPLKVAAERTREALCR